MGAEYYAFASFVFVLALIVVFLAVRGRKKNREEDGGALERKKQEIMLALLEAEQTLAELKVFVKNSEEKISLQLRRMEMDMQAFELARERERVSPRDPAPAKEEERQAAQKEPVKEPPVFGLYEEAEKLRRSGMDAAEIARTLRISAGEANLILKMAGKAGADTGRRGGQDD